MLSRVFGYALGLFALTVVVFIGIVVASILWAPTPQPTPRKPRDDSRPVAVVKAVPEAPPMRPVRPKPPAPAPPLPVEPVWLSLNEAYIEGAVTVKVTKACVGPVTLSTGYSAEGKYVVVDLQVSNSDTAKVVNFRGWDRTLNLRTSDDDKAASLKDDLGNDYPMPRFGLAYVVNAATPGPLYSDRSVTDEIAFNRPVPAAKELRLELPASVFGGTGVARWKFPVTLDR